MQTVVAAVVYLVAVVKAEQTLLQRALRKSLRLSRYHAVRTAYSKHESLPTYGIAGRTRPSATPAFEVPSSQVSQWRLYQTVRSLRRLRPENAVTGLSLYPPTVVHRSVATSDRNRPAPITGHRRQSVTDQIQERLLPCQTDAT